MHKQTLALLLSLFLILGSGCMRESRRATSTDVQIDLSAVPFPAVVGETRLVIRVLDRNDQPVDDAALAVRGDMTHAGMRPVLAQVQGGGVEGYYDVPFEWTMSGDWIVTVEATLADGTAAQRRFDLSILTADEAACTVDDPE